MPEFYKAFFRMLVIAQFLVIVLSVMKVIFNVVTVKNGQWTWWGSLPVISISLSLVLIGLSSYSKKVYYERLYLKFSKEQGMKVWMLLKFYF